MEGSRLTRILLYLAVFAGLAAATLVARPSDTPPPVKQTHGWHAWWWHSARVEDPLYRSPQPAPWEGTSTWVVADGSTVELVFRAGPASDSSMRFVAPASGDLKLDTRNLDSFRGTVVFDLATLSSKRSDKGAAIGSAFAAVGPAAGSVEVIVQGAEVGAAPRFVGAQADGLIVVATPGGEVRRSQFVVAREGESMLSIRTVQPGKWSLAQDDPRAAVLAGALGIAGTADASLHLRLVITREDH